jgi:AcrR family transcriptional regulator
MNIRSPGRTVEETQLSRGQHTRREILDAARRLFMAQGYTATPMRQIAAGAGITPAAIYNHFSGKDEILTTLLFQVAPFDELFDALDRLEGDAPEALLKQAVRTAITILAGNEAYLRLALIDAQERQGAALATLVPQVLPRAQEIFSRLAALDGGQGRLRDIPFLAFMRAMVSLILGYVLTERVLGDSPLIQLSGIDWPDALADILLHGVLEAPKSKGE